MSLQPAVFLDRDGTLNQQVIREGKPYAPVRLEDFRLLDDAAEGCKALKAAGYILVVATNQPDVGRGDVPQSVVDAMHRELIRQIPEIDRVEVSFDTGRGEPSRRRKPAPGMLFDAAQALGLDLSRSWMVGDRWRDVDCGEAAGVRTVFIDFGYAEKLKSPPDHTVSNFSQAVRVILGSAMPV
jgi:D-glycero-D-manno-heptose 1,7-bisphosphate phosphatase